MDCAITVVLIFPPLPPFIQYHPLPQAIPTPLFIFMGHACKFFGYSISYTVLYIPWLFCNYLFVLLNPLTSYPFPHTPLLSSNHQNVLHIHDSISVLVCLVCFLDSIDKFVFITMLLFIVLILFFFLNKSL